MWTVTLKLLPLVVTGHLMGGMATAALLCWLMMASNPSAKNSPQILYDETVVNSRIVDFNCSVICRRVDKYELCRVGLSRFPYCQGSLLTHLHGRLHLIS